MHDVYSQPAEGLGFPAGSVAVGVRLGKSIDGGTSQGSTAKKQKDTTLLTRFKRRTNRWGRVSGRVLHKTLTTKFSSGWFYHGGP